MAKKAKFHAVPVGDGEYNLVLISGSDVLFNDRQGRPKGNLKRDLARIKRATATAELVIDEAPSP